MFCKKISGTFLCPHNSIKCAAFKADSEKRIPLFATIPTVLAQAIEKPSIEPRKTWRAAKPKHNVEITKHTAKPFVGIVVHATATWRVQRQGTTAEKVTKGHQAWHQGDPNTKPEPEGKGWADLAYHYLIAPDGRIFEGRSLEYQSDTGALYPRDRRVTVVLEGNFEDGYCKYTDPKTKQKFAGTCKADDFNEKQKSSLDRIVAWLADTNQLSADAIDAPPPERNKGVHPIAAHGEITFEVGDTSCPGKPILDYLPKLREKTSAALRARKS